MHDLPRLPLEVSIDLTYRCTNACRHCWLVTADTARERAAELSTDEWRDVVDQARALGTRRWSISGGEPMLREDFAELFDSITRKAVGYSLNTNGTLISPQIARLLTRKGRKMVALYGATAAVHDAVTRSPGSFDAAMEGFARLKEAGAGFTVQLIPLRANWHEWDQMQELAASLSRHRRVGAPWLFLSACGDAARNAEIARQRLDPADVIGLDEPVPCDEPAGGHARPAAGDDRVYARCLAGRRDLHIDPYGGVAHCSFVKDPALRFALRDAGGGIVPGALERIWEEALPAVADAVCGGPEYLEGCGSCTLRDDCRWCGVYGYLEHGRHGAKVEYLCAVARAARRFKDEWRRAHRRTWQIGGMTVQLDADRPILPGTFSEKFRAFEVPEVAPGDPGADGSPVISIRHHFDLPSLEGRGLGRQVYRTPPWAIYRSGGSWIYLGISPDDDAQKAPRALHRVVTFNDDHTRARIYNQVTSPDAWSRGDLASVTMFPTDQILLARVLADRGGLFLHSSAVVLDGAGICFVGHSGAGKSTTTELLCEGLGERVEVLCDDRNVVRWWPEGPPPVPRAAAGDSCEDAAGDADAAAGGSRPPGGAAVVPIAGRPPGGAAPAPAPPGFWVHGTWSHGTVPLVSAGQAPLRALVFLRKDKRNEIVPLADGRDVATRILPCVIRPFVTADWWEKTFDVVERLVATVPAYEMRFDKSGAVVPRLASIT